MQVRYENMIDPAPAYLKFRDLHLRAFPAINKKTFIQRL